jgi:hypothetical protein
VRGAHNPLSRILPRLSSQLPSCSARLRNPDYKDLNLALNIVAKTGAAPWVLPESIPDADFSWGYPIRKVAGELALDLWVFADVFNQYGRREFFLGGAETFEYSNRGHHYEKLVAETLVKTDALRGTNRLLPLFGKVFAGRPRGNIAWCA